MPGRGPRFRKSSAAAAGGGGTVVVSGAGEAAARAAWLGKVGSSSLSPKQRRFVVEYVVDVNATQAAIRAGYSEQTADRLGARLLQHPDIAALLAAHAREVSAARGLEVKRIEEELAHSVFFDPIDIFDCETGAMLPLREWPERARRAIVAYEEEALFDTVVVGVGPRGGEKKERVQVGVIRKVKWHNKVEAARLALQRLGALTEKHELVGPANVTINIGTRRRHEPLSGGDGACS